MKRKHFYGEPDQEFYIYTSLQDILHDMQANNEVESKTIVELAYPKSKWESSLCSVWSTFDPECGKECLDYRPLNGKSGRCKFLKPNLELTGKMFKVWIDQNGQKKLKEINKLND